MITHRKTPPGRRALKHAALISAMLLFSAPVCPADTTAKEQRGATELESLTVTSQKREESIRDVPGNVTAVDGFLMDDLGKNTIDTLTELAPNINVNRIDSHTTQVVFRGIGGLTNMNKVWNTNVDGVTIPYVGMDMFLDPERVELIRGSQGALYGRNSHAGMVNVISRKPTEVFTMDSSLEVERFNTTRFKAAFGGPLGPKQGYRLALGYTKGDGYYKNSYRDKEDGGEHEQFSGRATWEYKPAVDNTLRLSITGDSYDGAFDVFTPLATGVSRTTTNNEKGSNEGSLFSPTLTWEKAFPGFELTTITNVSSSDYSFSYDMDFSPADLMSLAFDEQFKTVTQEVRVSGEKGRLQWLGGLFFLAETNDIFTDFSFGQDAPGPPVTGPGGMHQIADATIDSQGGALFGQTTLTFLDRWKLRTGLRVDYERRDFTWQGRTELGGTALGPADHFSRDDDWMGLMPSASLSYALTPKQQAYGSVSRGYKVGDYAANQFQLDAIKEPVDPEYTVTWELGYKGLLADNRLELNTALFYIDYTDMQVSIMKDNVAVMQNAAEAHSYGAEVEAIIKVADRFDLLMGLGWLEGEFDSFDNHPSGKDLAGNDLPNANKYSATLGGRYRHESGFFTSFTTAFMGPKYMDEENTTRQESYTLVSAKVGYESDTWGAYLYGRNLLDETYLQHTFANAGRVGEPAVVGGRVNVFF